MLDARRASFLEASSEWGQPMVDGKSASTVEIIKNAADAAKSIIIILAILLVIFGHRYVDVILNKYNVTKLDFGGVTIDRGKAIESLAQNADKLPQAQAALQKSVADLKDLQIKHNEVITVLEQTRSALSIAQTQLAQHGASAASQQAVSSANAKAGATVAAAESTQRATDKAVAATQKAVDQTQAAVRDLPKPSGGIGGYAVVFGGDTDLPHAQKQIQAAQNQHIEGKIFFRQRSYRSVSVFDTRDEASAALPKISKVNQYTVDAYIVSLRSWCPAPEQKDGYSDCGI